jgi:hypothetical protein
MEIVSRKINKLVSRPPQNPNRTPPRITIINMQAATIFPIEGCK